LVLGPERKTNLKKKKIISVLEIDKFPLKEKGEGEKHGVKKRDSEKMINHRKGRK